MLPGRAKEGECPHKADLKAAVQFHILWGQRLLSDYFRCPHFSPHPFRSSFQAVLLGILRVSTRSHMKVTQDDTTAIVLLNHLPAALSWIIPSSFFTVPLQLQILRGYLSQHLEIFRPAASTHSDKIFHHSTSQNYICSH